MPRNAWRVADVRAAESALMAQLPDGTLMARAASGLAVRCAALLVDRFGGAYGRDATILVGAGDNGGDALYAGALLARRGVAVQAVLLDRDRAHAGGLAALIAAYGRVADSAPNRTDLVIDGIVGIGGRGGLRPQASALVKDLSAVRAADGARPAWVAVDLPSGVNADTGVVEGDAVVADVTVTFGTLKPGLLIGDGSRHAGFVDLVDIGLGPHLRGAPALRMPTADDIRGWWPKPGPDSDKYTRGVVGVATGSREYTGAALLSVAGACAGPAGLVRYAGGAADLVRAVHPSVIPADRVGDAGRVQAWVCGSGLGTDDRAMAEVRGVLAMKLPVCLDADALTLISDGRTAQTADLLRQRTAPLVVTPHDREYARLAGREPGSDRLEAALNLAAKLRATVLLKGTRTIVASPDGTAWVNPTGSPVLATGGTGDVLAGLLGSLLATGLPADRAAIMAAYAHGLAGRLAAGDTETASVTSADVAAALPAAIAGLGRM